MDIVILKVKKLEKFTIMSEINQWINTHPVFSKVFCAGIFVHFVYYFGYIIGATICNILG